VLNKSLAQAFDDALAHLTLSAALAHRSRMKGARDALDRFRELAPDGTSHADAVQEACSWLGPGLDRVLAGARRAGLR